MKLIITSRRGSTAGGLGRYTGGDIFSSIGRAGLNKVINKVATSTVAQKVANAVVDGARKGFANAAEKKTEQLVGRTLNAITKAVTNRKRPSPS